ncbi:unnamed protein product [Lactuca saligna]|uniref:Myb-like domain-containing protein n=1 Tax=Lactuca saligna TaxID=75948 RepID=A0AA35VLL3_LACSI|nr:unnamed protein product [Lactuca saligna]
MGDVKAEPIAAAAVVWPTVNPSVNGGASGTPTTCLFQSGDTIKFSLDVHQVPIIENHEALQNTFEKNARGDKWDFEEDMALMSAWCVANELQFHGKNQKKTSLWAQVKKLYNEAQSENPKKLGLRNDNQMRGRWKRLNENAIKWIESFRKAYKQKTSEMSLKDIENEAHKIYATCGSTYNDIIVFNEVMCKYPKWELLNESDTNSHEDDESGDSTKRIRTNEEGDYCFLSNTETPNSGGSTINREYKKKEKCSLCHNECVMDLRAIRITRESEVEVMRKKLDLEQRKEERKVKKEERKSKKVYHMHLNTLLAKEHLSPEDEDVKRHLLAMLYGK